MAYLVRWCLLKTAKKQHLTSLREDSSDVWELGLLRNAHYSREHTSRYLCQVVGLSESDAFEATSQVYRLGVALIDEFHSEHVEYFAAELHGSRVRV